MHDLIKKHPTTIFFFFLNKKVHGARSEAHVILDPCHMGEFVPATLIAQSLAISQNLYALCMLH
jgi:hypothetical protein